MRYYDFSSNWDDKCRPHLKDPKFQDLLKRNFGLYVKGRFESFVPPRTFEPGSTPSKYDLGTWRKFTPNPEPFWDYVCSGACHWLVNSYQRLAQLAEPDRDWRIVSGEEHSSVWDGEETLFDPQYCALQENPKTIFDQSEYKILEPRKRVRVYKPIFIF